MSHKSLKQKVSVTPDGKVKQIIELVVATATVVVVEAERESLTGTNNTKEQTFPLVSLDKEMEREYVKVNEKREEMRTN